MKSYKEYDRISIGGSDIAALILVGPGKDALETKPLCFGSDGSYSAYLVDGDAAIGSHYALVAEFHAWMRIYDDAGLVRTIEAETIRVYAAGEMGCIIQAVGQAK